ncbi:hypothetical protein NQP46_00680 [Streptomyces albus]|nr:hypothetical protein NQP46_00680 [Streptomyces albus]
MSNGALHFHFENKRALAQAVGEHARRTLRLVVEEAWAGGTHALPVLVEATFGLVRRLADDVVLRAGFELGAPAEGAAPRSGRSGGGGWTRWSGWPRQRGGSPRVPVPRTW